MEEKKNNKGLIIGLIIFLIVCLIGSGYFVYKMIYLENNTNSDVNDLKEENDNTEFVEDEKKDDEYEDTFSKITESGKVRVTGYATIDKLADEGEELYDYIFFHILDTKSQDFIDYIKSLQGNAFAKESAIGIGCVENNKLSYVNDSDELGMTEYKLTEEETNKIINSSKDKTITLELERLKFTGGSGAPICYSHITNIKIVD